MRRLWIAAGLAVALSGLIWWSLEDEKKKAEKPEAKAGAPRILDIPVDQFQRIELKRPAEDLTIVLERGASWRITAPQAYGADTETVDALVKALSLLDSSKLVEEKATDFAPYGFNAPRLVVSIKRKDGKSHTLEVADDNPANGEYYARLAGSPRLFTLGASSFTPLDRRLNDLRDKRLVTFDAEKVKAIELTAKGGTIEFAPTAQKDWQITKPRPLRADGLSVEEILRRMRDARMDLNAKVDPASFTAGTTVASVKVTDANGAQTFELRKSKEDYFAKTSAAEGVHKLTKDVAEALDKDLAAFRNKKVFDFGFAEVNRIDFKDGARAAAYERKGGDWMLGGKKVDKVPAVVDKLRDLSVLRFLDAGMAAATLDVTVTSATRKERVQIAKSANMWIAQREGSSELYEIDGKLIEDLQKAASEIK